MLDRRLLEALKGPLIHLVRNAVDHGLEKPAEREAAGKHGEGVLLLRVELQGKLATVEMADDGAGIDVARVKKEALRQGLETTKDLSEQRLVS